MERNNTFWVRPPEYLDSWVTSHGTFSRKKHSKSVIRVFCEMRASFIHCPPFSCQPTAWRTHKHFINKFRYVFYLHHVDAALFTTVLTSTAFCYATTNWLYSAAKQWAKYKIWRHFDSICIIWTETMTRAHSTSSIVNNSEQWRDRWEFGGGGPESILIYLYFALLSLLDDHCYDYY